MRALPLILALVACGPLPTNNTTDSGQTTASCPQGSNWLATESAGMTITFLTVDNNNIQASFNPTAEYDDQGPSACYDSTSTTLSWVFEASGAPYGRLTITPATSGALGAQEFDGSDGSAVMLDLFGASTPQVWTGADFLFGGFNLRGVAPLVSMDLDADGQRDGRIVNVILSAEMTTDTL